MQDVALARLDLGELVVGHHLARARRGPRRSPAPARARGRRTRSRSARGSERGRRAPSRAAACDDAGGRGSGPASYSARPRSIAADRGDRPGDTDRAATSSAGRSCERARRRSSSSSAAGGSAARNRSVSRTQPAWRLVENDTPSGPPTTSSVEPPPMSTSSVSGSSVRSDVTPPNVVSASSRAVEEAGAQPYRSPRLVQEPATVGRVAHGARRDRQHAFGAERGGLAGVAVEHAMRRGDRVLGQERGASSTPSPSRVIASRRTISLTLPSSTSATSSRVELVPRSTAPTLTGRARTRTCGAPGRAPREPRRAARRAARGTCASRPVASVSRAAAASASREVALDLARDSLMRSTSPPSSAPARFTSRQSLQPADDDVSDPAPRPRAATASDEPEGHARTLTGPRRAGRCYR